MHVRDTPGDTQESFPFAKDSAPRRYIVQSSELCSEGNCCLGTLSPLVQKLENNDRAESRKLVIHLNRHCQSRSLISWKAGLQSLSFSVFFEKARVILIHARGHVRSTESSRVTQVNGVLVWHVRSAAETKHGLGAPLGHLHMGMTLAVTFKHPDCMGKVPV